jgi:hypothetical protein
MNINPTSSRQTQLLISKPLGYQLTPVPSCQISEFQKKTITKIVEHKGLGNIIRALWYTIMEAFIKFFNLMNDPDCEEQFKATLISIKNLPGEEQSKNSPKHICKNEVKHVNFMEYERYKAFVAHAKMVKLAAEDKADAKHYFEEIDVKNKTRSKATSTSDFLAYEQKRIGSFTREMQLKINCNKHEFLLEKLQQTEKKENLSKAELDEYIKQCGIVKFQNAYSSNPDNLSNAISILKKETRSCQKLSYRFQINNIEKVLAEKKTASNIQTIPSPKQIALIELFNLTLRYPFFDLIQWMLKEIDSLNVSVQELEETFKNDKKIGEEIVEFNQFYRKTLNNNLPEVKYDILLAKVRDYLKNETIPAPKPEKEEIII